MRPLLFLAFCVVLGAVPATAEILLPPDPTISIGNVIALDGFVDENDVPFSTLQRRRAGAGAPPVWVVSPMYTRCPHTCSPITQSLKKALGALPLDSSEYGVVSFSFDRDESAAGLRSFRAKMDLPADWMTLRAADAGDLERVLKALDFRTISLGDGQFDHPNLIAVLTPDLRLYGYLFGVTVAPGELERALRAARDGPPRVHQHRALVFALAAFGFVVSALIFAQVLGRGRRRQRAAARSGAPPARPS